MRWLPSGLFLALLVVGPCLANGSPSAPASSAAKPATSAAAPAKPTSPASVPSKPAAAPVASNPATIPDYGGRSAPGLMAGVGSSAPDPLAQAGRSLLALVIVLGGVWGVMIVLKRAGYSGSGPVGPAFVSGLRVIMASKTPAAPEPAAKRPDDAVGLPDVPATADGPLTLVQSQALPGGGAVHLLSIDGQTRMLVGATAQGVSLLAEWEWEDEEAETLVAETQVTETPTPVSEAPDPVPTFAQHLTRAGATPSLPVRNQLSDLLADTHVRTGDN